jgi:hypothetical protein
MFVVSVKCFKLQSVVISYLFLNIQFVTNFITIFLKRPPKIVQTSSPKSLDQHLFIRKNATERIVLQMHSKFLASAVLILFETGRSYSN